MAAPWVSGTVALMFSAAGRPLTIHDIRRALIGTTDPHPGPSGRTSTQLGYGYLNTAAAVAAARRIGAVEKDRLPPTAPPIPTAPPVKEGDSQETAWAPVWVEDAAAGASIGDEVSSEEEIEESESAGALEAADQECGCGRHQETAQWESGGEPQIGFDDWDEGESTDASEADDAQIPVPFVWEDVQEALDAVDQNEA